MTESIPSLHQYLFIDECGDPNFYGKRRKPLFGNPGYQPLLMMGLMKTSNRQAIREAVLTFQKQVATDDLYASIPSLNKPKGWFLHAKDDHAEIRAKFFELLRALPGFSMQVVLGRKSPTRFSQKHNSNPAEFYFDLLHHLLRGQMLDAGQTYNIYLAQRDRKNMDRFQLAIDKALQHDNTHRKQPQQIRYNKYVVLGSEYPELSVVDYCLWALQRYIHHNEVRFFRALQSKYNFIMDLYDGSGRVYSPDDPFDLNKAALFEKPLL